MPPLIHVRDLVKVYPGADGGVRAVDGISFDLHEGRCLGLLGPNGAGKTTTLEMLEGILVPTSGELLYRGRPRERAFREEIGIQFQTTALQDYQTVGESLAMFASLYRRRADMDELIALCSLDELLDRDTRKLSGGQRQRLLLAIALINDPKLVFLDEPTTGLDPASRRNFWTLIETVRKRGKTVILTTHYMEEAERLCDEILIVEGGRIIARGEPRKLIREHLPAAVVRLPESAWPDGAALPPTAIPRNRRIELHTDDVPATLRELDDTGAALHDLQVSTPTLEDLFLKLTGHGLRG